MKKIYILFLLSILLGSCNSYYKSVSLNKVSPERKNIALNFVTTYLRKCDNKDYSELKGFNISKRFEAKLNADSLEKSCENIAFRNGKITVDRLVSVHTITYIKDYADVFNIKVKLEKSNTPFYLHLGMYRDQNYIDFPFYFSAEENYYNTIKKNYPKK